MTLMKTPTDISKMTPTEHAADTRNKLDALDARQKLNIAKIRHIGLITAFYVDGKELRLLAKQLTVLEDLWVGKK